MGTRGYVIIRINNKYYTYYNNYDSYPSDLGKKIWYELREYCIDKSKYNELKNKLINMEKSTNKTIWYNLESIKILENELDLINESNDDYYINNNELLRKYFNDIFIEYVYIIDFDENNFEMYSYFHKYYFVGDLLDVEFVDKLLEKFIKIN
jgi:hypothetical protein